YPAIDIEASISRVMQAVVTPRHWLLARRFKQLLSSYQRNRDLITIGAYRQGSDAHVDAALALWPRMRAILQQDITEAVDAAASMAALEAVLAGQDET